MYVIDYTPYLCFTQCAESQQVDSLELERLTKRVERGTVVEMNGDSGGNRMSDSLSDAFSTSQPEFEDDNLLAPETFFDAVNQANDSTAQNGAASNTSWSINLMLNEDVESMTRKANSESQSKFSAGSPIPSESNLISRSESAVSLTSSLFADLVNQKSFLEELLSQRINQNEVLKAENDRLKYQINMKEKSSTTQRQDYEAIILELQEQISVLFHNQQADRSKSSSNVSRHSNPPSSSLASQASKLFHGATEGSHNAILSTKPKAANPL